MPVYAARRSREVCEPGSPEWLRLMTASKVSAVLGLSPWDSPFGLWHRMNGTLAAAPSNVDQERGHYHEEGVLKWFKKQHPDLRVRDNKSLWISRLDPRFAATPDGIAIDGEGRAGVEVKTSAYYDWRDGVPAHYRCQCVWQAHVLGLQRVYVAALTKNLEHVCHVIEYDREEGDWIEQQVRLFLESLESGTPPPLDDHAATTTAIRELHPEIEHDSTIELTEWLAVAVVDGKEQLDAAKSAMDLAKNQLADAMGFAHRAKFNGHVIARRQAKQGGTPYVQLVKGLPDLSALTNREAVPA